MKTLIQFLFFAACIALYATCQQADQVMDDLSGAQLKKAQPITVTVPFKFEGISYFTSMTEDAECGSAEDGIYRIVVDGPGNATEMGKLLFHAEFCCNTVTGEYGFGSGIMYFEAANGDRIYLKSVSSSNFIVDPEPGDPPYYLNKWHQTNIITGGTGRFEGASGELESFGYNRIEPEYQDRSFHLTTGNLTLIKGKR